MKSWLVAGWLTVLVGFLAPSLASGEVTGGGWIPGAGGGKATFGVDIEEDGTGSFTYHDKSFTSSAFPKGLNLHGTVDSVVIVNGVATSSGSYTAEQRGTSGYFLAAFGDTGESGAHKGDTLHIELYADAAHSTLLYSNTGTIGNGKGGGNITVAGASPAALAVFGALLIGYGVWRRRGVLPAASR